MSVVAYRNGVLAADRQATAGQTYSTGSKLYRVEDGEAVAFCGRSTQGLRTVQWYVEGADPDTFPVPEDDDDEVTLVVARPDGTVWFYEGDSAEFQIMQDEYAAWGSGREIAYGAMERGASAVEAVDAACQRHIYCGMGIDFVQVVG